MLLVVFGAGASFDSVHHLPAPGPPSEGLLHWQERPPLANQLFDTRDIFEELMERFKECQALVPMLRQAGTSVEKKLAEFQQQAKTFPPAHRELAAVHYYLHFALWTCQNKWYTRHRGTTNFATLLREIERWRYEAKEQVCFVTFNYDTMLEEAMGRVLHLEVQDMDSYCTWENYSLFKLHGSVNWGRVVDGIRAEGSPVRFYQQLIDTVNPGNPCVTEEYRLCDIEMRPRRDPREVLYPALSIPVEKKDEFSCPSGHVTALETILPRANKMITIGWRASEQEFLNMLLASRMVKVSGIRQPLELLVVTGSKEGAEQTVKNLAAYGVNQDIFSDPDRARVTTGFTGLIDNLDTLGVFLRKGLY